MRVSMWHALGQACVGYKIAEHAKISNLLALLPKHGTGLDCCSFVT
jgi:hypothetical protein